jgi:hypothetical protein
MKRTEIVVAAAFAVFAVSQASAQDSKFPGPNLFGQKKPAQKPPAVDWNVRPPVQQTQPSTPAVICGMTVVPADPKVDAKMRVAPKNDGVKYAMRIAPPTVCKAP